jgi:hypothetical protein
MPGDHPHQSPTVPILIRFLAPGHFLLRPQLLTRISDVPRARRSRRRPASIGCWCSPLDDVRLCAGTLVSPLCSTGGPRVWTALSSCGDLQPAMTPKRVRHTSRMSVMRLKRFRLNRRDGR